MERKYIIFFALGAVALTTIVKLNKRSSETSSEVGQSVDQFKPENASKEDSRIQSKTNLAIVPSVHKTSFNKINPKSESAGIDTKQYQLPGFEHMSIDPLKEQFIVKSKMGTSAKKLFLAGMALINTKKNGNYNEEASTLEVQFLTDLKSNQKDFVEGIKSIAADEKQFPPGFREDLINITSEIQNTKSTEIQSLAMNQLQESIQNQGKESPESNEMMLQASMSYVSNGNDPAAAIHELKSKLDLNDPRQATLFEATKAISRTLQTGKFSGPVPASNP